jgi:hypothetical protein
MKTAKPLDSYFIPEPMSGCWLWLGGLGKDGYGMAWDVAEKKSLGAHRWVYMLLVGPIPEGQNVLHRCDNPCCVNPDHLFLGSLGDNNRDRKEKGRGATGVRHPMNKLSVEQVLEIRNAPGLHREIAGQFGVSKSLISHIKTRRLWKELES